MRTAEDAKGPPQQQPSVRRPTEPTADGCYCSGGVSGVLSPLPPHSSRWLSHTTESQYNLHDLTSSKSTSSFNPLLLLLSRSTDTQSSLCGGNEKGEEGARLHSNACLSDERGRHGKGQGREGGSPIRLTDRPRPSHRTDRRTDGRMLLLLLPPFASLPCLQ